jgi:hypothetical protein
LYTRVSASKVEVYPRKFATPKAIRNEVTEVSTWIVKPIKYPPDPEH